MVGVLRLLLVHAHPDDETLTHGGTVAAALAGGHEVDLVTCTRGEEGEVIGETHAHRTSDRDDTLADVREAELAAALDALARTVAGAPSSAGAPSTAAAGDAAAPAARPHPTVRAHWLDGLPAAPGHHRPWPRYRDSGMVVRPGGRAAVPDDVRPECFAVADLDEAAARLAGLVARRRPHVVLTYGPHGGYGHPDHVMAHRVTVRALELAEDRWTVPWVHAAAGDARALRGWLRDRRTTDASVWDPDGPLPHLFVEPGRLDATVDARPWRPAVLAALRALPTQVTVLDDGSDDRPATFALSNDTPQPLTGLEHSRLLRPVPAREDLPPDAWPAVAADDPLAPLLLAPGARPRT